jgi:hypothetical protein
LNIGVPSFDPIRCANQNNEIKDPGRGICPQGNSERKEPFKSKCDSGMCWVYFTAYGIIEFVFISAFVEGAIALELPLSKHYVFPNPLDLPFCLSSYHICKCPFIRFEAITSLLGTGANTKRVEIKFGLDFECPLLSFLSFCSIILLF